MYPQRRDQVEARGSYACEPMREREREKSRGKREDKEERKGKRVRVG